MFDFSFPAKVVKQKNGKFEVSFIDIDEAFTEGETLAEALDKASEVLSGVILTRLAHGMVIPKPSKTARGKSIHFVLPDGKTQSALLVRAAFAGKNVASIARHMDTSWPAVNRLRNPAHWPTLKLLERALRAAGKQLVITMKDKSDNAGEGR